MWNLEKCYGWFYLQSRNRDTIVGNKCMDTKGGQGVVGWIGRLKLTYIYIPLLLLLCRFSHVWLCDPVDGSPPGSPVPGILQARTLEWVAISFSSAWKWKVKVKSLSRVLLLATPRTAAYQAPLSMDFPGKSTGVGCHCLLWYIHTTTYKINN